MDVGLSLQIKNYHWRTVGSGNPGQWPDCTAGRSSTRAGLWLVIFEYLEVGLMGDGRVGETVYPIFI
jgi:hypothetical protein